MSKQPFEIQKKIPTQIWRLITFHYDTISSEFQPHNYENEVPKNQGCLGPALAGLDTPAGKIALLLLVDQEMICLLSRAETDQSGPSPDCGDAQIVCVHSNVPGPCR